LILLDNRDLNAPRLASIFARMPRGLAPRLFTEIAKKGKTGGSRVKFLDEEKRIINLHKPHPDNIVKQYVIKQILEKLTLWKIISVL